MPVSQILSFDGDRLVVSKDTGVHLSASTNERKQPDCLDV